jgi:c-di-GMP-binding flagellar brake protein YcgR
MPESSIPNDEDRRSEARRKSRINKLVHATVRTGDEQFLSYLYLVDISLGGMRANLDRALEPESTVELQLPVGPYLPNKETSFDVACRVVWRRPLPGGTFVHGFEFLNLTPLQLELASQLFAAFTPEGMRERFRLNQILNIAYEKNGQWLPRTAFDISPEGLGIQMREALPEDEVIRFLIYLQDHDRLDATEVQGKVSYLAEFEDGLFRIGVKFVDLGDHVARRIRAYIDRHR